MTKINKQILHYAKDLRMNSTDAERIVWNFLRNRKLGGLKFKRQYPIGRYILDFYCFEKKIAIELDGGQHNEKNQEQHDKKREDWLKEEGIRVFRFWNNDILNNMEGVVESLLEVFSKNPHHSPHPGPLPEGEGE